MQMFSNVRGPTEAEQLQKKEYKKMLEDLRAKLLLIHPFTASLALYLELVPTVDSRLKTAATDGSHIFFQIEFLKKLSPEMIVFVLAHEVWHCVAGHLVRKLNRDPELWNYAVDHEVNALLQHDGFRIPDDAVYIAHYDTFSAEQVYDELKNLMNDSDYLAGKEFFQFDLHEIEKSGFNDELNEQIADDDFKSKVADGNQIIQDWQSKTIFVANHLKSIGSFPEHLNSFIEKMLEPELHWKMILRQFVQRAYSGHEKTWCPPSRRHLWRGLYLPSSKSSKINLVIAIDTSGSVYGFLKKFLSEVVALVKEFNQIELCLIECDAEISNVRNFSNNIQVDDLLQSGLNGGGGTSFIPVFQYVTDHQLQPDCLVFFTDGEGQAPEQSPDYPVLWVLPSKYSKPSSWGSELKIKKQKN